MKKENDYLLSKALIEINILPKNIVEETMNEAAALRKKGQDISLRQLLLQKRLVTNEELDKAYNSFLKKLAEDEENTIATPNKEVKLSYPAIMATIIIIIALVLIAYYKSTPQSNTNITATPTTKTPVVKQERISFVSVVSDPNHAEITIDGKRAGSSPLKIKLSEGPHTIEAILAGYGSAKITKDVIYGETEEIKIKLKRKISLIPPSDNTSWYYGGISQSSPLPCQGYDLRRSSHSPHPLPDAEPNYLWELDYGVKGYAELLILNDDNLLIVPKSSPPLFVNVKNKSINILNQELQSASNTFIDSAYNLWYSNNNSISNFNLTNKKDISVIAPNKSQTNLIYDENKRLFYGSQNIVTCFDHPSESFDWEVKSDEDIISLAAIPEPSLLFAHCKGGIIIAIDRNTGQKIWNWLQDTSKKSNEIFIKPIVISTSNKILLLSESGKLIILNAKDGKLLKETQLQTPVKTPAVFSDFAYILSGNNLLCLDINTGEKFWEFPTRVLPISDPVINFNGNEILFTTGEGVMRAVSSNGKEKWSVALKSYTTSYPFIGRNQMIYVLDIDGYLYAYGNRNENPVTNDEINIQEDPFPALRPENYH